MKIDYRENIIWWKHQPIPMEEVRKEYLRQFPNLIGKHKIKVTDQKLVVDWRTLFNLNNTYLILWNILKSKQNSR